MLGSDNTLLQAEWDDGRKASAISSVTDELMIRKPLMFADCFQLRKTPLLVSYLNSDHSYVLSSLSSVCSNEVQIKEK